MISFKRKAKAILPTIWCLAIFSFLCACGKSDGCGLIEVYDGFNLSYFESGAAVCEHNELFSKQGEVVRSVPCDGLRLIGEGLLELHYDGSSSYKYQSICGTAIDNLNIDYLSSKIEAIELRENENGRYGYINPQGAWIIKPHYRAASQFVDGYAIVIDTQDNAYLLDASGAAKELAFDSWQVESAYSGIIDFNGTVFPVYSRYDYDNKEIALADINGNIITDSYQKMGDFGENCVAVREDGKWKYIDFVGKPLTGIEYKEAYPYENGAAVVETLDGDIELIDYAGNTLEGPIYKKGYSYKGTHHDGLYAFYNDSREILLNSSGKIVFSRRAHISYYDSHDCWVVFSNSNITEVFLPECGSAVSATGAIDSSEDTVTVSTTKGACLYDRHTGKKLFSADGIEPFSEGLAAFENLFSRGYINSKGEVVIKIPLALVATSFNEGLATVARGKTETNTIIANPLLYTSWTSDETQRAASLGIDFDGIDTEIDYEQLWSYIEKFDSVVKSTYEKIGKVYPATDIDAIRKSLEANLLPSSGIVDRENLAAVLSAMAAAYGKMTDGYLLFCDDYSDVDAEYLDAAAYIWSQGIFGVSSSSFEPKRTIQSNEMPSILLRLLENVLLD